MDSKKNTRAGDLRATTHTTRRAHVAAQTKAAPSRAMSPASPPVYSPNPVPKVLQAKPAAGGSLSRAAQTAPPAPRRACEERRPSPFTPRVVAGRTASPPPRAPLHAVVPPRTASPPPRSHANAVAQTKRATPSALPVAARVAWSGSSTIQRSSSSSAAAPKKIHDAKGEFKEDAKGILKTLAEICGEQETIDGKVYDVIDLVWRSKDTPQRKLFAQLYADLGTVSVNYKNGPVHRNLEGKLPASENESRYIECYYCSGGMRIVYDMQVGRAFVSDHYGIFYVLTLNGQNPVPASVAREAGVYVNALTTEKWDTFTRLYGHKVPK